MHVLYHYEVNEDNNRKRTIILMRDINELPKQGEVLQMKNRDFLVERVQRCEGYCDIMGKRSTEIIPDTIIYLRIMKRI